MKLFKIVVLVALAILLSSCKKNDNPVAPLAPTVPAFKVGEVYVSGTKAQIYADDSLRAGYNKIYVTLTDSVKGTAITDAHVFLTPVMAMMTMSHSCPVEQPDTVINGYFTGAIYFTMASNSMEKWSLTITVHNHLTDIERDSDFPAINVGSQSRSRISVVTGSDNSSYVFALIPPQKFSVGLNTVSFGVYHQDDPMNYSPVSNLSFVMTPTMPSMGHGSTNNVNPTYTLNGLYKGTVNLSMSGEWKIACDVKIDGTALFSSYFMIQL